MTAQLGIGGAIIPKGAKNVDVAKEFMKYLIQPKVTNGYLKEGLGRWLPAMPSLVKSDPFWLDPSDPHRSKYAREGLIDPTVANYPVFNPAGPRSTPAGLGLGRSRHHPQRLDPEQAADKARSRKSKRSWQNTRSFRAERRTWHPHRSSKSAAP